MLVETYVLAEPDALDQGDFDADLDLEIEDAIKGPAHKDGDFELYDTPFIFDMCDVSAINKSQTAGYSNISLLGERLTVKLSYEEARKLMVEPRSVKYDQKLKDCTDDNSILKSYL